MAQPHKEWIKYANRSEESGVEEFWIEEDLIKIKFVESSKIYVYTYNKPGKEKVDKMKYLAESGKGLSTFVSQHIRDKFEYTE